MLPALAVMGILDRKDFQTYGLPKKEGSCFRNDENRLHTVILISEFEAQYRINAAETDGVIIERENEIDFPVPVINWDELVLIFKTEKYLNYFGYGAGRADGIFETSTKNAIKKYQNIYSITPSVLPSKDLLNILANEYFRRPQKQRINEMNYSGQEIDDLYGY